MNIGRLVGLISKLTMQVLTKPQFRRLFEECEYVQIFYDEFHPFGVVLGKYGNPEVDPDLSRQCILVLRDLLPEAVLGNAEDGRIYLNLFRGKEGVSNGRRQVGSETPEG